ncbi:aminopeptidase N, partial [Candidatus Gracilibacteria bacterium]|nr:aminopeptidase N [Candidatus Gracilibacteria bacterium]
MTEKNDKIVYLKDYEVPAYEVESYDLNFDLYEDETLVTTSAKYYENINHSGEKQLLLNGEDVQLVSIFLDEKELTSDDYSLEEHTLILKDLPAEFTLEIVTKIHPETNTSLEGLYKSGGKFCTQCETHGFRRMTYFQDRPDVMTMFIVRITADKEAYPVLLSNGNKVEEGDLDNGRHFAIWKDPFKKPCYLFALVAGNLEYIEDTFTTMSGKDVVLRIFTESHNLHKCPFAMESLKKSMVWDEQRYGLEYDLDIFMIVAVDDFNSGAMENKGLNIFNSACIFATPDTATDRDFIRVEKVIAHEYFHNWTGDRVTCRDWFQLSLKEGLTVYRDHEFTSDTHSRSVARIESVKALRNYQFSEDASPMAHSIRPASFEEISNFYTFTVYEKGSEVIGIYESILGRDGFRKGMDLYFDRHDGQAVTTEDFLAAMRDANQDYLEEKWINLNQMQNWYNQAGTPVVDVVSNYDEENKKYTLFFRQHTLDTPETPAGKKKPFLIPIKYSLFNKETGESNGEKLFVLQENEEKLEISNVESKPLPSLLRGFSSPIKLNYAYSTSEYLFLVENETDDFNRFEALQNFSKNVLIELITQGKTDYKEKLLEAFTSVLKNSSLDNSFKGECLVLPSESELMILIGEFLNPQLIHEVRSNLEKEIAQTLESEFTKVYEDLLVGEKSSQEYNISTTSVGN